MQLVNYSYARNNLKLLCKVIKNDIEKSFQEIENGNLFSIDVAFESIFKKYEELDLPCKKTTQNKLT